MTLRLKSNPDIEVDAVLTNVLSVQKVVGLDDDGTPILGLVDSFAMLEDELVIRDESLVFLDDAGSEYWGAGIIEEVRPDGSVVTYQGLGPKRALTVQARAIWINEVTHYKTLLGFHDWVESLSDAGYLEIHGMLLRKRDINIKADIYGTWQVTRFYNDGRKTWSGDGTWALIGDDRGALYRQALETINTYFAKIREVFPADGEAV